MQPQPSGHRGAGARYLEALVEVLKVPSIQYYKIPLKPSENKGFLEELEVDFRLPFCLCGIFSP